MREPGDRRIADLTLLSPLNLKEFEDDKFTIVDVKATDFAHRRFTIEMQVRELPSFAKRMAYYLALYRINREHVVLTICRPADTLSNAIQNNFWRFNMASLRTNLVKIGNSQGVRLPKAILQQIHLIDEIEIEVKKDCLVLKPAHSPRAGWDEGFKKATSAIPDSELEAWEKLQIQNDEEEWTWK